MRYHTTETTRVENRGDTTRGWGRPGWKRLGAKRIAAGLFLKDLNSTVAKRGSVFIVLMTSDGAIWFRYQRAVLMR